MRFDETLLSLSPKPGLELLEACFPCYEHTQGISSPFDVFGFWSLFLHRKQYVIITLCTYIIVSCSDARSPTLLPSFLLVWFFSQLPVLIFLETGFLCVPQASLRLLSAGIIGITAPCCYFTRVDIDSFSLSSPEQWPPPLSRCSFVIRPFLAVRCLLHPVPWPVIPCWILG